MIRIEADPQELADKLKQLFAAEKANQLKKPYRPASRFNDNELWLNAARTCIHANADPYSFIRAAFIHCVIPGGPFPQTLCSARAESWYDAYNRRGPESDLTSKYTAFEADVHYTFHDTLRFVLTALTKGIPIKQILMLEAMHGIPAIVRIILLPNDADIRAAFKAEARVSLRSNPALMDALIKLKCPEATLQGILQDS